MWLVVDHQEGLKALKGHRAGVDQDGSLEMPPEMRLKAELKRKAGVAVQKGEEALDQQNWALMSVAQQVDLFGGFETHQQEN